MADKNYIILLQSDPNEDRPPGVWFVKHDDTQFNNLIRKCGYRFNTVEIYELSAAPSQTRVPWGGMMLKHICRVDPTQEVSMAITRLQLAIFNLNSREQILQEFGSAQEKMKEMFARQLERVKDEQSDPQIELIDLTQKEGSAGSHTGS